MWLQGLGSERAEAQKLMKKLRKLKKQTMDVPVKQLRIFTGENSPDE